MQEAEDPEEKNDRDRNADQPEKATLEHRRWSFELFSCFNRSHALRFPFA